MRFLSVLDRALNSKRDRPLAISYSLLSWAAAIRRRALMAVHAQQVVPFLGFPILGAGTRP